MGASLSTPSRRRARNDGRAPPGTVLAGARRSLSRDAASTCRSSASSRPSTPTKCRPRWTTPWRWAPSASTPSSTWCCAGWRSAPEARPRCLSLSAPGHRGQDLAGCAAPGSELRSPASSARAIASPLWPGSRASARHNPPAPRAAGSASFPARSRSQSE